MKRILSIFPLIACLLFMNACSKNDDAAPGKTTTETGSFAMWVQVGSWPNVSYYIMSLNSVTEGTATLSGNGVDVTSVLNASVIKRDSFYYYYNTTEGRFGKYQIVDGAAKVVKEVPFTNFASLAGHTWIDDNTLVMIGTNAAATAVNYSTVDVRTMTITNGTFEGLPALPAGYNGYRVGGDLQYVNGNLFFAVAFRDPNVIMYAGFSEVQASYPGFKIGNVIVMAGVPSIMQAMMDIVAPKLKSGVKMLSDSVRANAREGDIGGPLREIANAHPDTIIGSYPFLDENQRPNTNLVVRSRDPEKLNAAMTAVKEMLAGLNANR